MDNLRTLVKSRRTCRNYADKELSREQLTALINDAVWVASGSNNQPWRFVVITDKEKLKAYSDKAKQSWLANLENTPYMQQYESFLNNPDYNIFYNAPALVIIYGDSTAHWHVYDCSMVAHNIHLMAQEDGLGCCWIGFAHNILDDPATKKELGVPENYELVAPLILGYPHKEPRQGLNPNKRKEFEIIFS